MSGYDCMYGELEKHTKVFTDVSSSSTGTHLHHFLNSFFWGGGGGEGLGLES